MQISKLRGRRVATAAAFAGGAALVLAGCTTGGGDEGGGDGAATGGTITVGQTNAMTSLNSGTPQSNLNTNGMINYLTGPVAGSGSSLGGFWTLDPEFNIVPNEDIGTYELLSEDPLTVEYTITEGATWSDGEQIDANDMVLAWAISSGYFDEAEGDEPHTYFSLAGSTSGLEDTALPEVSEDNMTITLTYDTPYVDWEIWNVLDKPAHVVADQAGLTEDELMDAFMTTPAGDEGDFEVNDTIQAAADFWNTGYDISEMPSEEALLVGSGPFIVSAFTPEQSVTLSKNPEYSGSYEPAYDDLVIRFIGDAQAQVQALQNGEVDVIQPQPSADTLSALENAGVETIQGDELSYDHLDLNFGAEVFQDENVREAFLKTIPRQQILDSIIAPINPEAEVLNSQIFVASNTEYADTTAVNGYADAFGDVDIEGARELLDGEEPTVEILYNTENPNRVDAFQAIQSSAAEAGFNVVDKGSPQWSELLTGGEYDASIFGWVSPGIGNAALPQIFAAGGGGNYNAYDNSDVTEWANASQQELDLDALNELKYQIDTATAEDFYGLPLFQSPGIYGVGGAIDGVEYFAGQTGVVWNAQDWTVAE